MYGLQTQLSEKTALAHQVRMRDLKENEVLIPHSYGELIIPLHQGMEVQLVGTLRSIGLKKRTGYFLKPRGKGMKVLGKASYVHILLHPGYTKHISDQSSLYANGLYTIKKVHNTVDQLVTMALSGSLVPLNGLLEYLFDLERDEPDPIIMDSIDMIKDSFGATSIKRIYTSLGVSKSTLEQRFNKDIGLTPKEFCKIEKLNRFVNSYNNSNGASLTALTYQCGYYDQSHLIKDFRYFLDMCPRVYFQLV